MITQIKRFRGATESTVNRWLAENSDIQVIDIKVTNVGHGMATSTQYTVIYRVDDL